MILSGEIGMGIICILAFIVACGAPIVLTVRNLKNLFAIEPKKEKASFWLTLIVGLVLYVSLYCVYFDPAGDWWVRITTMQTHYSISSNYVTSIAILTMPGIIGLIVLTHTDIHRVPPLVSAFFTAMVGIMNVVQTVFVLQLCKNVSDIAIMLYVYHFNIFILSIMAVKKHVKQLAEGLKQDEKGKPGESVDPGEKASFLKRQLLTVSGYSIAVFACLFLYVIFAEVLFILFGQGVDAPIKAFTDTADWTFSKQIPPQSIDGHYLCTVAASGHRKVVKPLRYGHRYGREIIVNRQLCIANAFEDYIHEKHPTFHRIVRHVYDRYGYPISRHITTPARADAVYIIMKPLEWLFLVFLYSVDCKPEERIRRQYL